MSAQTTTTKLFISYSRHDDDRIERLYNALLSQDDLTVFRDIHDILPSEEWQPRLEKLIRESDTILYAISPSSIRSDVCKWELGLAEAQNKRIIPVVIVDIDGEVPAAVAKLNYIFLTDADDFALGLSKIRYAINLDIDWIREHTRLAELAGRWEKSVRFGAQPLRGKELEGAEKWLLSQPRNAPEPTELHRAFIIESRRAQARRQRRTVVGALAALGVVGLLAAFAWVQRNAALENERLAQQQTQIAHDARDEAEAQRQLAEDNAHRAEAETARAEEALIQVAAERDRAERNFDTASDAINALVFDIAQGLQDAEGLRLASLDAILSRAEVAVMRLLATAPDNPELRHIEAAMRVEFAEVYAGSGEREHALTSAERAYELLRGLLATDPENRQWQRDISIALERIGDLRLQAGDVAPALEAFNEGLEIRRRLAEADPAHTGRQRDVSISLERIGTLHLRAGAVEAALGAYTEALTTRRHLAAIDPLNAQGQHDISVSLNNIGDLHLRTGDTEAALRAYQEALDISRHLVASDPGNTLWQRGVAISFNRVGDVQLRDGDTEAALTSYQQSLEIAHRLAAGDPDNTEWQRDVSISLSKIGDLHRRAGDLDSTLTAYTEALAIARQLSATDPGNTN